MTPTEFRRARLLAIGALIALAWGVAPSSAGASKLVLKDGRALEGRLAWLSSLAESAAGGNSLDGKEIILCDDSLRRYFISWKQRQEIIEGGLGEPTERFVFTWQRVAKTGSQVLSVGPLLRVDPFDEFGRRIVTMSTNRGPVSVIQGITSITPVWTKVEALERVGEKSYVWDQRIATSSIPLETLDRILNRHIDPKNIEHRLKIVRLYVQSERFRDAEQALANLLQDFPDHAEQFAPTQRALRQSYARRGLSEIRVRRDAGQHQLALQMLKDFPTEGVAGEVLQEVRQLVDEYRATAERGKETLAKFNAQLAEVKDSAVRERLNPIRDELVAELNINTLPRMAAYRQFADDASMTVEEKLALAVSGWLVGTNDATRNLPTAMSLFTVRDLVQDYLNESVSLKRSGLLERLGSQEGATPLLVARLLDQLRPPLTPPRPVDSKPGYFALQVDGLVEQPPISYFVQLPPEYDPLRRYPTIVTLHGAGTTPDQQVDWWAGGWDPKGFRLGQATRQGYIVIAPAWAQEKQSEYRYSAEEHTAVLNSLRDACRRFSIDTDRVFLSGHSMGGDAAWDIGLAHPDLWAGVIPIVATADRYVAHYSENAKNLPCYFVGGELDGDKLVRNARDLDRYMRRGYNATVVEFQGRGHEHFSDEIVQLFDWMQRLKRDFSPREFDCRSLRDWDNFFWWVEVADLPSKAVVPPSNWPPPRGTRPVAIRGVANQNNGLQVSTGAGKVTVWLAPELVDFGQRINVTINGARVSGVTTIEPDLAVLLEDARTRADRRHPFWAKIETPPGRGNVAER